MKQMSPQPLPLHQYPNWNVLINKFGHMILNRYPDLQPHFLELLDQSDLL